MRSLEDTDFSALCNQTGTSSLIVDDVTFQAGITDHPNENNNDAFNNGQIAIIIKDNERCSEINQKKIEALEDDEQESLAIAKTTARYAQCMGALKSFESRRKRPRLLFPKFVKGFCSDRH